MWRNIIYSHQSYRSYNIGTPTHRSVWQIFHLFSQTQCSSGPLEHSPVFTKVFRYPYLGEFPNFVHTLNMKTFEWHHCHTLFKIVPSILRFSTILWPVGPFSPTNRTLPFFLCLSSLSFLNHITYSCFNYMSLVMKRYMFIIDKSNILPFVKVV